MDKKTLIIAYPASDITGDGTIVEIGPGRGDFLFHLAESNLSKVVCGIEIKGLRFDKLRQRIEKRGLKNVRLIMADAVEALPEVFPDSSVEAIFINFPDPWPKRRHAKNRLLKDTFIGECARILAKGGLLSITTDVEWYAKETFAIVGKNNNLLPATDEVKTESTDAYPTLFSEKWKREGRTIYYQRHQRK